MRRENEHPAEGDVVASAGRAFARAFAGELDRDVQRHARMAAKFGHAWMIASRK
jgi:hypothetical protein